MKLQQLYPVLYLVPHPKLAVVKSAAITSELLGDRKIKDPDDVCVQQTEGMSVTQMTNTARLVWSTVKRPCQMRKLEF